MLVVNNQLSRGDLSQVHHKLHQIVAAAENLPPLLQSLKKASDEILASKKCKPKEEEDIRKFIRTIESFQIALSEFTPEVVQLLTPSPNRTTTTRKHFIVLAGRCLQASDNLRALSVSPLSREDDLFSVIQRMLFEGGPVGIERLAFPTMRDTLIYKHNAIRMPIQGSNKNLIDTMIIPCGNTQKTTANSSNSRASHDSINSLGELEGGPKSFTSSQSSNTPSRFYSPSKVGTVLFCSPNAALYEVFSYGEKNQKSWMGFYLSLGFDICYFNYRGYGASEGSASPAKVKADGLAVLNYLQREYKIEKIIIHGESIGGMVGCYLAKHAQVIVRSNTLRL